MSLQDESRVGEDMRGSTFSSTTLLPLLYHYSTTLLYHYSTTTLALL